MDLSFNNLQKLICHKPQTNKQRTIAERKRKARISESVEKTATRFHVFDLVPDYPVYRKRRYKRPTEQSAGWKWNHTSV